MSASVASCTTAQKTGAQFVKMSCKTINDKWVHTSFLKVCPFWLYIFNHHPSGFQIICQQGCLGREITSDTVCLRVNKTSNCNKKPFDICCSTQAYRLLILHGHSPFESCVKLVDSWMEHGSSGTSSQLCYGKNQHGATVFFLVLLNA